MSPTNANASDIRSKSIIAIPSQTITGQEFQFANIVWIKTSDGDYDLLFDQHGEPVIDAGLVKRVGDYFEKGFKPVLFDGKMAYAQVNDSYKNRGVSNERLRVGGSEPGFKSESLLKKPLNTLIYNKKL